LNLNFMMTKVYYLQFQFALKNPKFSNL